MNTYRTISNAKNNIINKNKNIQKNNGSNSISTNVSNKKHL